METWDGNTGRKTTHKPHSLIYERGQDWPSCFYNQDERHRVSPTCDVVLRSMFPPGSGDIAAAVLCRECLVEVRFACTPRKLRCRTHEAWSCSALLPLLSRHQNHTLGEARCSRRYAAPHSPAFLRLYADCIAEPFDDAIWGIRALGLWRRSVWFPGPRLRRSPLLLRSLDGGCPACVGSVNTRSTGCARKAVASREGDENLARTGILQSTAYGIDAKTRWGCWLHRWLALTVGCVRHEGQHHLQLRYTEIC